MNAASYDEGSAGAVFRKHLGRTYDFFAAYRFSEVAFNVPPSGECIAALARAAGLLTARRHDWGGMASHADSYRIIFWPPQGGRIGEQYE